MTATLVRPTTHQPAACSNTFFDDVIAGLTVRPQTLPCKYFYNERGSALFDQICAQHEYYLTRTELAIMRQHAAHMADLLGPKCLLIELGSGSSLKTRTLLTHLVEPAGYVPVDICEGHMTLAVRSLALAFPDLPVLPVAADFCSDFGIPEGLQPHHRKVVYFPGSTIGNFTHNQAVSLLRRVRHAVGRQGGLLIGVDLAKDADILEAAYNDPAGVTQAFNLNLLHRLQDELDADVDVDQFEHRAFFNAKKSRIEMHLMSTVAQTILLGNTEVKFNPGETIYTEHSYKYTDEMFAAIAHEGGFKEVQVWTDEDHLFSARYLTPADFQLTN